MITFQNIGKPEWGRLGNQMFQYAALFNIANLLNYDYGIPYSNEEFGLKLCKYFNITARDSSDYYNKNIYNQESSLYDGNLLYLVDNTDISGFFQSELFFRSSYKKLKKEFEFKPEIQDTALKITFDEEIYFDKPIVAMHIRRDDYLIDDNFSVLPISYYKESLEYITSSLDTNDFMLLIFSDDIEWCKNNLNDLHHSIKFIYNSEATDLRLMSLCNHFIIANSSYSWWGAYLSQNENKIVIAPKYWFDDKYNINYRDVYPKNWKTI